MCLGIPGQIISITDDTRQMAMADVSGVQREVVVGGVLPGIGQGQWISTDVETWSHPSV